MSCWNFKLSKRIHLVRWFFFLISFFCIANPLETPSQPSIFWCSGKSSSHFVAVGFLSLSFFHSPQASHQAGSSKLAADVRVSANGYLSQLCPCVELVTCSRCNCSNIQKPLLSLYVSRSDSIFFPQTIMHLETVNCMLQVSQASMCVQDPFVSMWPFDELATQPGGPASVKK